MSWYDKYTNLPFKHLGDNPQTGIDCVNLCILVYKEQLGVSIDNKSYNYCNIIDTNWYNKVTIDPFLNGIFYNKSWKKVTQPKEYDIIVMSIGSTNVNNHTAIFIEGNKILHILEDRKSFISPYGSFYKQYTTGIFRWKYLNN